MPLATQKDDFVEFSYGVIQTVGVLELSMRSQTSNEFACAAGYVPWKAVGRRVGSVRTSAHAVAPWLFRANESLRVFYPCPTHVREYGL